MTNLGCQQKCITTVHFRCLTSTTSACPGSAWQCQWTRLQYQESPAASKAERTGHWHWHHNPAWAHNSSEGHANKFGSVKVVQTHGTWGLGFSHLQESTAASINTGGAQTESCVYWQWPTQIVCMYATGLSAWIIIYNPRSRQKAINIYLHCYHCTGTSIIVPIQKQVWLLPKKSGLDSQKAFTDSLELYATQVHQMEASTMHSLHFPAYCHGKVYETWYSLSPLKFWYMI